MAIPNALKVLAKAIFKPSTAWAFLFFPALFYYMGTRLYSLGLFRSSTYGDSIRPELIWVSPPDLSGKEACSKYLATKTKDRFLYVANNNCRSLKYPLYVVQENLESVVSTTWMEDEELGRGYLLVSTSAGNGKVYRWEAGGGPIAIGRTLHLNDSGCRSNLYRECSDRSNLGSGGIVVDAFSDPSVPRLIVAEYGEGRVVRMEENGARTPLVIGTNAEGQRLVQPFRLLTTPYGDLMVMDNDNSSQEGYQLWRLPKASKVPALPSLSVSRQAHAWKKNNDTELPHIFFRSQQMGGMVLDPSGQRILITTMTESSSLVVVSLPLLDDLDEEEGGESSAAAANNEEEGEDGAADERASRDLQSRQSTLVFDYTAYAKAPGAIEVDNNGNLYLAVEDGVLVVSNSKSRVAKISFPADETIADLTLGSDKFLYIAMESKLARIRVPNMPLEIKKDLLIKA